MWLLDLIRTPTKRYLLTTMMVPGVTIATDLICGFPGETETDFQETVDLVKLYRFPSLFINQFYPRPGTPAAKMEQVPAQMMIYERMEGRAEADGKNRGPQGWRERREHVENKGISDEQRQPRVELSRHAAELRELQLGDLCVEEKGHARIRCLALVPTLIVMP
ncbi:Threonylcarbamoyladenosine tRNA methylthiotransferase [Liparis tanakae]|uniref:Threonylcarbamoyladenosine tRNA methylthiotransferase n=1 Tax=Liparis tanakae TaxID=230148 RepID=A0A4Z2IQK6_9TELE|nr:Threonylcarbamoyladenosine tRNA methylthiotransferase [Liparis tanakae]